MTEYILISPTIILGVTSKDTVFETSPLKVLQSVYVTTFRVDELVCVGTPFAFLVLLGLPFSSLHHL